MLQLYLSVRSKLIRVLGDIKSTVYILSFCYGISILFHVPLVKMFYSYLTLL